MGTEVVVLKRSIKMIVYPYRMCYRKCCWYKKVFRIIIIVKMYHWNIFYRIDAVWDKNILNIKMIQNTFNLLFSGLSKCTPHILCLLILRACTYIVVSDFKWNGVIWSIGLSFSYASLFLHLLLSFSVNWFAHLFSLCHVA